MKPKNPNQIHDPTKMPKIEVKDGGPEVFVLPPDLLQKLGIHLSNIHSSNPNTVQKTENHEDNKPEAITPETSVPSSSKTKETSISETADLMKTSVFLSPTFISNGLHNSGEFEIASNIQPQQVNNNISVAPHLQVGKLTNLSDSYSIKDLPIIIDQQINGKTLQKTESLNIMNQKSYAGNQTTEGSDLISLADLLNETTKPTCDDHHDKAYATDCNKSNTELSNPELLYTPESCKNIATTKNLNTDNKLAIISEEILTPSQINEIKTLHASDLTKVPMNSLIPRKSKILPQNVCVCPESIVIFDEKGNKLTQAANYIGESTVDELASIAGLDGKNIESHASESNLDICIDFVVTDLERHLKEVENEEVLESFVKDITSADGNAILKKIEESEKDTSVATSGSDRKHLEKLTKQIFDSRIERISTCANKLNKCVKSYINSYSYSSIGEKEQWIEETMDPRKRKDNKDENNLEILQCEQTKKRLASENIQIHITDSFFDRNIRNRDETLLGFESYEKNEEITQNINTSASIVAKSDTTFNAMTTSEQSKTNKMENINEGNVTKSNINIESNFHDQMNKNNNAKVQKHNDILLENVENNDKVKEIALLLSQFAKTHTYFGRLRTHPNKYRKTVEKHSEKLPLQLKIQKQGVEKPGGSNDQKNSSRNKPPIKTYYKTNKLKPMTVFEYLPTKSITENKDTNLSIIDTIDSNTNDNISYLAKTPKFCLCSDYGRLAFYDSKIAYEHIHFWELQKVDCDKEVMFEIYCDRENVERINIENENIIQSENCNQLPIQKNICWHSFEMKDENYADLNKTCRLCHMIRNSHETRNTKIKTEITAPDESIKPIEPDSTANLHEIFVNDSQAITTVTDKQKQVKLNFPDKSLKLDLMANLHEKNENLDSRKAITEPVTDKQEQVKRHVPEITLEYDFMANLHKKEESVDYEEAITGTVTTTEKPKQVNPSSFKIQINEKKLSSKTENYERGSNDSKGKTASSDLFNKYAVKEQCKRLNNPESQDSLESKSKSFGTIKEDSESRESDVSSSNTLNDMESQTAGTDTAKSIDNNKKKKNVDLNKSSSYSRKSLNSEIIINTDTKETKIIKNAKNLSALSVNSDNIKCGDSSSVVEIHTSQTDSNKKHDIISERHHHDNMKRRRSARHNDSISSIEPPSKKSVKCGVCELVLSESEWEHHVEEEHCFVAWMSGNAMDFADPKLFEKLNKKAKETNRLKCTFCARILKNSKNFLSHVQKCYHTEERKKIEVDSTSIENTLEKTDLFHESTKEVLENSISKIMCGVCKMEVTCTEWMEHTARNHNYLAWKYGENPLIVDDKQKVREHLGEILKEIKELTCYKCGLTRKKVYAYLKHIENCKGSVQMKGDTTDKLLDKSIDVTMEETDIEENTSNNESKLIPTTNVKCGVCKASVSDWINHIAEKHNYVAWKENEAPLDTGDTNVVFRYLNNLSKQIGGLICPKCGLKRKYVSSYQQHVKQCTESDETTKENESMDLTLDKSKNDTISSEAAQSDTSSGEMDSSIAELKMKKSKSTNKAVICGVCKEEVTNWLEHISEKHQYAAWKEGEEPWNTNDETVVQRHLNDLSKEINGLICYKCGLKRKYAIPYQHHIKACVKQEIKVVSEQDTTTTPVSKVFFCGVCHEECHVNSWSYHIFNAHQYMAWKEGDVIDLNDEEQLKKHLTWVLKHDHCLICHKCRALHRSVSDYLEHIKSCEKDSKDLEHKDEDLVTCVICFKEVKNKNWPQHKMQKHYNVAWKVGERPIDVKNPNVIVSLMDEYKQHNNKYKCRECGLTRASGVGFYAHVIACGKTEEELELHKGECNICGKKYLYIYQSQHMAWHHVQNARQKAIEEEESKPGAEIKPEKLEEIVFERGKRKAAQMAQNIIEKIKEGHYAFKCPDCKFGADSKDELDKHNCKKRGDNFSDSGESCNLNEESEDDSEDSDSDIDSDVSEREHKLNARRERRRDYVPPSHLIQRFPYQTQDATSFLKNSAKDFCEHYSKTDDLFPDLRQFEMEAVTADKVSLYIPPLEESCKIKSKDSWKTLKRFEAAKVDMVSLEGKSIATQRLFVGGYVQCISWAPVTAMKNESGQYLAVVSHPGTDIPYINFDETLTSPNLIQIWDFDNFTKKPNLAMGLAVDVGHIWAMSWCPSGARDVVESGSADVKRLGLLAVASSNGSAFIFSVPYPHSVVKGEQLMYKIKPVIELRVTMTSERKRYQATSISWSKQKDHKCILVGYADGSIAFFDLTTESPLLKTNENNISVVFPYHDEKLQSTCITGVDLYPSMEPANLAGLMACSSLTGTALVSRPGERPWRQQTYSAVLDTQFQPLWPAATVSGDDANMATAVDEVELAGHGRRWGGGNAAAACWRCGRVALAHAPLLRVHTAHPAACKNKKRKEAFALCQMTHLAKKRKIKNDELQMMVEPDTYEGCIQKYGLEFRTDKDAIEATYKSREYYPERFPERFPLNEVTSMAFCPSERHHKQLALATHSGVIFVFPV